MTRASRAVPPPARADTQGPPDPADQLLDLDEEFSLEQVAEMTDMTARNVRAYQQRQLLPPGVRRGRRVVYTYEHVSRVRLVRALHEHGLTLRLIRDLVERGIAASELARLGREEVSVPLSRPRSVPMNSHNVAWFEQNRPGTMAELAQARLVHIEDGRAMASAAGLGLTGALGTRGFDVYVLARLSLLAAEAAAQVAPAANEVLAGRVPTGAGREEDRLLLVQLLATSFGDVLRQLVGDADA